MSTVYAIISGLKDAREHKPPYFWALFTDPSHRVEMLRDGWKSTRNVFLTLPVGCSSVRVGGIAYSQCGPTYYQRVGSGYQL